MITNFNPLSPHGERLKMFLCNISISLISIHSPLTGRDSILRQHNGRNIHFNPLSPHGERHNTQMIMPMQFIISIHSPLTGRDKQIAQDEIDSVKISIHSPLTGRDVTRSPIKYFIRVFQSTLPSRGETYCTLLNQKTTEISIHSPLTGRDGHGSTG